MNRLTHPAASCRGWRPTRRPIQSSFRPSTALNFFFFDHWRTTRTIAIRHEPTSVGILTVTNPSVHQTTQYGALRKKGFVGMRIGFFGSFSARTYLIWTSFCATVPFAQSSSVLLEPPDDVAPPIISASVSVFDADDFTDRPTAPPPEIFAEGLKHSFLSSSILRSMFDVRAIEGSSSIFRLEVVPNMLLMLVPISGEEATVVSRQPFEEAFSPLQLSKEDAAPSEP
mmetsp:Transcript_9485/g.23291  ORF Transcript_9485/g.23291 Transcript_9485/m.23291 type:complete len:227 (-) Transcript_9485:371-1051(-)